LVIPKKSGVKFVLPKHGDVTFYDVLWYFTGIKHGDLMELNGI